MVLRTISQGADSKGKPAFLHFEKPSKDQIKPDYLNLDLNKIMQNVGGEQFHYDSFKALYDTDPRVKEMISNFSEDGIELKSDNAETTPQADADGGEVEKMAKRATDLSDL